MQERKSTRTIRKRMRKDLMTTSTALLSNKWVTKRSFPMPSRMLSTSSSKTCTKTTELELEKLCKRLSLEETRRDRDMKLRDSMMKKKMTSKEEREKELLRGKSSSIARKRTKWNNIYWKAPQKREKC